MATNQQTTKLIAEYKALLASPHVTENQHDRMINLSRLLGRGVWSKQP